MKEQKQLPKTIKFGDCELDVPSGVVIDGGRSTRLDPKSVDVAIYLAEHCDQLVTHDQLLEAVWPNKFVTESQLSKRITEIRQALGDNQKPHRYIETLPKRGYRLVCQCEIVEAIAESIQTFESNTGLMLGEIDQAHSTPWTAVLSFMGVVAGVIVIALGYFVYTNSAIETTELDELQVAAVVADKSIAVLLFDNLAPDRSEQWYANGVAEDIRTSLARLPELRVSSRSSSLKFRGENLGIREIAMRLDVAYVLEVSVRKDGDRLRITAKLIRAADDYTMWADSYDDSTEAIFDVEKDVAESIAATLGVYLDDERRDRMIQIGTRNVAAYEAYLRGVDTHTKAFRNDGILTMWDANEFFERAKELDPDFAAPILMHHDAFVHVVSQGNGIPRLSGDKNPMLLPAAALELALADLDLAKEKAINPSLRLVAEFNREYFSPTWYQMPRLIARLRELMNSNQWSWSGHSWVEEILQVMGEHELSREWAEERLRADPLDIGALRMLVDVEFMTGNFIAVQDMISRGRVAGLGPIPGIIQEIGIAQIQGNREEAIRLEEELMDIFSGTPNFAFNEALLAAFQGDYAKADQWGIETEVSLGGSRPGIYLLRIYHETGNWERHRALVEKIDAWPAGAVMFSEYILQFGYSLPFDLADAPKFAAQLQQAGIDLDAFSVLPRLSTMGNQ